MSFLGPILGLSILLGAFVAWPIGIIGFALVVVIGSAMILMGYEYS